MTGWQIALVVIGGIVVYCAGGWVTCGLAHRYTKFADGDDGLYLLLFLFWPFFAFLVAPIWRFAEWLGPTFLRSMERFERHGAGRYEDT